MVQTTPPVPPLPSDRLSPAASPASDAFPTSPRLPPILTAPDMSKPLPPLQTEATGSGKSYMFAYQRPIIIQCGSALGLHPRPQSSAKPALTRDAMIPIKTGPGKRRSMSVGEVDLKKATSSSLAPVPPPPSAHEKRSDESTGWDSTIRGILSDFSRLDQDNTTPTDTLDLRLPSTSAQRPARLRMRSAEPAASASQPDSRQAASSPPPMMKPNPTIVAYAPDTDEASVRRGNADPPEVIVSGRSPPLAGAAYRSFTHPQRPFPGTGNRPLGPRSASSVHTPLEARDRLLAHPRSTPTAISSEPSLLANANAVSPPLSALSQQDLSSTNLPFRRLPSDGLGPEELEARGKECARRAWEEDEEFLVKERIAEWLGGMYVLTFFNKMVFVDTFIQWSREQGRTAALCGQL